MSRKKNQEETTMENVTDEMKGAPLDTEAPADANTESTEGANNAASTNADEKDDTVWKLADGSECSKSAFIREQFTVFNKSRKEISDEFKIPYRTVYGATVNMENAAEPTSRGRGVTFSKIQVTSSGALVVEKDGAIFVNGEKLAEGIEKPETHEVDRNEWIKAEVAGGADRAKVAKMLDLSYGVIYGLTKDAEGSRQKYEVEIEDPEHPGQTVKIPRSEYIRKQVAAGVSKADIAKELGVEYSVVWQATKTVKSTEEKFKELVESIAKFADAVENPDVLKAAVESLSTVVIKKKEPEAGDKPADNTDTTVTE